MDRTKEMEKKKIKYKNFVNSKTTHKHVERNGSKRMKRMNGKNKKKKSCKMDCSQLCGRNDNI